MSLDDDNNADIDIDSAGDRENDDNGVDDDDIMKAIINTNVWRC